MKQKSGTDSLSFGKDPSGCSAEKGKAVEGQAQKQQAEPEHTDPYQKTVVAWIQVAMVALLRRSQAKNPCM